MAKQRGSGDWLVLEEKLERGDPSFVDDLRSFYDAEFLAGFAARWYADKRAASRRLLLEYLDRPLNAFRHEPLVKRLFKQAEGAGDDEVMRDSWFSSIARYAARSSASCMWNGAVKTEAKVQKLITQWRSIGFDRVNSFASGAA